MQTVSYMGNGTTTEFFFSFPYFENSNIVVTKNGAPVVGYNIVGNLGGADANYPYTGGKVVFDVAPTALDSISISRDLPLSRIVDYQPTAKINPTTLNQDLNYLMELIKDRKCELKALTEQYAQITDTESVEGLLSRIAAIQTEIAAVGEQIDAIGDLGQITTDITTLKTRTNGLLDYVVASQLPTAENGYTWYRKYKSGWIEQGGSTQIPIINDNGGKQIQLPVVMQNTGYFAVVQGDIVQQQSYVMYCINKKSGSLIELIVSSKVGVQSGSVSANWEVKGMAA